MNTSNKPKIITSPPGPKALEIIRKDNALLSPSLSRSAPLVGVETQGVWVKDIDDNVFLDFGSGIAVANVGHRHPDVVQAIMDQVQLCDHVNSCDYYTLPQINLAQQLLDTIPGEFQKRIFFTNSGTEAVECAIKVARWHSKRHHFLGYIQSFHGRTMGALQFTSTSAIARRFYAPMMPGVTHVPYPYCYRCLFKQTYPECRLYCLEYIEETVFSRLVCPDEIAGILFEPILGAGGYVIPPDEYWPRLYQLCQEHDILMIDDEVQTGFARTGKMWACEHWEIKPHIMCVSKAMAGGLPIGACIAKANVMDWSEGAHENTLGGNPIIVAAALAVLNVIQQEQLTENAAKLGDYILKRLHEIAETHEIIGDLRGKGLMIGMELVTERKTKTPATQARDQIILDAFKHGLLLLAAGPSSLRLAPPLILTHAQADSGLQIIEKVIDTVEKNSRKT